MCWTYFVVLCVILQLAEAACASFCSLLIDVSSTFVPENDPTNLVLENNLKKSGTSLFDVLLMLITYRTFENIALLSLVSS